MPEIQKTIEVGIRSDHKQTRDSAMPKFGIDKLLTDAQIDDAAAYVLSISGGKPDAAAAGRGGAIFKEQCASCHGDDGKGKLEQGAPNLTDGIWLYGGSKDGGRREHPHRPRRRHAGLDWPPRSDHDQGARRLRPQPRRRQVDCRGARGELGRDASVSSQRPCR